MGKQSAYDLRVHIFNLKCQNFPKLPFTNTHLNYQFMTIDSFKLSLHCDLEPQLDSGQTPKTRVVAL